MKRSKNADFVYVKNWSTYERLWDAFTANDPGMDDDQ